MGIRAARIALRDLVLSRSIVAPLGVQRSSRFLREISFHSKWSSQFKEKIRKINLRAAKILSRREVLPTCCLINSAFHSFRDKERNSFIKKEIYKIIQIFREINSLFFKFMNRHLRSKVNARNSQSLIRTRRFPGVTSSLAARFDTMFVILFMVFSFFSMSICYISFTMDW